MHVWLPSWSCDTRLLQMANPVLPAGIIIKGDFMDERLTEAWKLVNEKKIHFKEATPNSYYYVVNGTSGDYIVSYSKGRMTCECPNFTYRMDLCKHCIAVLMILMFSVQKGRVITNKSQIEDKTKL